jgi:protease I
MAADLVDGRRLTAWKTVQRDLEHTGADVVDEEVVVDDNLVTSRQPDDIPAFIERSLEVLREGADLHANA